LLSRSIIKFYHLLQKLCALTIC